MSEAQIKFTAIVAVGLYEDCAVIELKESILPGVTLDSGEICTVSVDILDLGASEWFKQVWLNVETPTATGIYIVTGEVSASEDYNKYSNVEISSLVASESLEKASAYLLSSGKQEKSTRPIG